jgi:hypothetical protein
MNHKVARSMYLFALLAAFVLASGAGKKWGG